MKDSFCKIVIVFFQFRIEHNSENEASCQQFIVTAIGAFSRTPGLKTGGKTKPYNSAAARLHNGPARHNHIKLL
jgi:hypothetical protein